MAKKRSTDRPCTPRVLRHGDEIALVLDHCDPAHRTKYTQTVNQIENQRREEEQVSPEFSLNRNGFAFYQKVTVFEDDRQNLQVRGDTTGLWGNYRVRVEF